MCVCVSHQCVSCEVVTAIIATLLDRPCAALQWQIRRCTSRCERPTFGARCSMLRQWRGAGWFDRWVQSMGRVFGKNPCSGQCLLDCSANMLLSTSCHHVKYHHQFLKNALKIRHAVTCTGGGGAGLRSWPYIKSNYQLSNKTIKQNCNRINQTIIIKSRIKISSNWKCLQPSPNRYYIHRSRVPWFPDSMIRFLVFEYCLHGQERGVEAIHARVSQSLAGGRPLSASGLCLELKWQSIEKLVQESPEALVFSRLSWVEYKIK